MSGISRACNCIACVHSCFRSCVCAVAPSPKCFFVKYTAHKLCSQYRGGGKGRKGEGEMEVDWKREMVSERNIGWWRERQMETKREREQ